MRKVHGVRDSIQAKSRTDTSERASGDERATPVWWAEAGFWCLIQNGILTAPSGMSAQVNEMSGTFCFCQPEEG